MAIPHKFALGIGSNWHEDVTDTLPLIDATISRLQKESVNFLAMSVLYQTKAFPANGDPDFVNGAALMETQMSPDDLLAAVHDVEHAIGRTRTKRWERRVIDLDILFYDDLVRPDAQTHAMWREMALADQMVETPDQLILPHPRIQDRPFVLVPLCDVAPDWVHPVLHKTTRQMCDAFSAQELAELSPIVR